MPEAPQPLEPSDCDLITINRQQYLLRPINIEQLIEADHPARLFWAVTGELDLSAFYTDIKTKRGCAGRRALDPRLMVAMWLYAYKRGIGSAREISRMCRYDPGMQWLTAMEEVNHHSLSDFRVGHDEALKKLFEQVLGMLLLKKLVTLERVTQDGTKILARVRNNSFRREGRIREHLEAARQHIEQMGDPRENPTRQDSAQRRAAKQRAVGLAEALEEIVKLRPPDKENGNKKDEPQVSETEPEARFMRARSGAVAPCYNVQMTTDGAHGFLVDIETTNAENDSQQLLPAMDRVQEATGQQPKQVIADSDYTNHQNVQGMAERGIEFYGSWKATPQKEHAFSREHFVWDAANNQFVCPEGKPLPLATTQKNDKGVTKIYRVAKGGCAGCVHRAECCGENQRSDRSVSDHTDSPAVAGFKEKMAQAAAQAIYKTRSAIAEFPNLWIKCKYKLRQFWTQGLKKAGMEARWAGITYNLELYFRLTALEIKNP